MADYTHTQTAKTASRSKRQTVQERTAQARLADKSFSEFMRKHNAKVEGSK